MECQRGRGEAASKGRYVVDFRKGNVLLLDEMGPEVVGFGGLGFTRRGEVGIEPVSGVVAFLERPVALSNVPLADADVKRGFDIVVYLEAI